MHLDLVAPDAWNELNDRLKNVLQARDEVHLRAYYGLAHSIYEIAQGTMQFYSHKRSVGVVKGQTWAFDFMVSGLLRDAIQVQNIDHGKNDFANWVEHLNKDTNFVLFSEDHPVTGEIYDVAELDAALNNKKIFSFAVSHSKHLYSSSLMKPFSARICSYSDQAAVVYCGERVRASALIAPKMAWNQIQFIASVQEAKKRIESQFLVDEFENKLSEHQFFKTTVKRIYDRAVLSFSDVSAEALAMIIFKKMNLTPEKGWRLINTTNQCHWRALNMFKGWWQPPPSPQSIRGLMVFSCEILETKDFANIVKSAYEELKALQSWSF